MLYPHSVKLLTLFAASAAAWNCQTVNLYGDTAANTTAVNGSTPQTAFSNVQDAALEVATIIANWADPTTRPQININLAEGTYYMSTYLLLTGAHSGQPDCPTVWKSSGGQVTLSGGVPVTNWTQVSGSSMWSASVPPQSLTRALYVDGISAPRAQSPSMPQNESTYSTESFAYNGSAFDINKVSGINRAELRYVGTFTDRYMPVDYQTSEGTLYMKQPAWIRNLIGYDSISETYTEGFYAQEQGMFIENSLTFLDSDGEWFLDVETNTLYYQPIEGKDPNTSDIILPRIEVLLSLGGLSYLEPAHDIQFINISFAHTTWNFPSSQYGFPDQQTGAFIGEQFNRSTFEAYRPFWWQTPGAVQISVAERIVIQGGSVTCTGAASLGVGNDDNAHLSGIGLGAKNVTVTNMTFTQSGGNPIQVGGIQTNAHHPYLTQMINSGITVSYNYLYDNARLFTSANSILFTYVQYSNMVFNTVLNTTYTAVSQGWGWGSNDAGGNLRYLERGTYMYQPRYTTATTLHDNYIARNYLKNLGVNHTDEGGIYTLSASPGTVIERNVILNSRNLGLYFDEGSRFLTAKDNVIQAKAWYGENTSDDDITKTGNNTFIDNYVTTNITLNGEISDGSVFIDNVFFNPNETYPPEAQAIVAEAGALWTSCEEDDSLEL